MSSQITGDSPQAVALELLERISAVEGKSLYVQGASDCKYILDTYRECLDAVLGRYQRFGPWGSG